MSNWAHFRKHWIKPEVYPLLGAMGAALGVCAAALINKARDPTVGWNKSKRGEGQDALLEGIDEVVPLWSTSSKNSTRIFGHDKSIIESKFKHTTLPEVVIVKAEESEEEEEADSVPEEVAEELTVAVPIVEIIDEAPEKIEAAVEAATHSIQETASSAEEAAPSIEEVKQSVEDAVKSVSGSAENAASSVTEATKPANS